MLDHSLSTDLARPAAPRALVAAAQWRRMLALLRDAVREASCEDERMIYVTARSPAAPAAALILRNAGALAADGVTVAGLFAEVSDRDWNEMRAMAKEYGAEDLRRYVRIADFPGWREQSERVRLGRIGLHVGPELAVRRPRLQDGELIDVRNQPDTAELARLAFSSAWAASRSLPVSLARSLAR